MIHYGVQQNSTPSFYPEGFWTKVLQEPYFEVFGSLLSSQLT